MPALNLALFKLSLLIRLTRARTREALLQDYVKFARAKGLSSSRVIGVHVLKNIMIPIVTVIGLEFGSVIAFAIVTESIFAWPGTRQAADRFDQPARPARDRRLPDGDRDAVRRSSISWSTWSIRCSIRACDWDNRRRDTDMTDDVAHPQHAMSVVDDVPQEQSPLRRIIGEFAESKLALVGLAMLIVVVAIALLAPFISPQNPYDLSQIDLMDSKLAPGEKSVAGKPYVLGTDDQGRDMLSGIFYGLRISLSVGVASTVVALAIGLTFGLMAAFFGGWVDTLIMRVVDIQLSFPAILIALILLAVFGQGVDKVIAALITVQWAYYARTVRASALVEMQKEYMEAARVSGAVENAHRVSPSAAELPASADRGGDRTGGACDLA